jgi:beta-barrel assembly-enhancing protease
MAFFARHLPLPLVFLASVVATPSFAADDRPVFTFTELDLKLAGEIELLDQKLEKEGLVYSDAALTEYLTRIGNSIVPPHAPSERVVWRFRAVRDPLPNAFALPNGSIYVHSGLLGLLENEDQLASVLAHEVTHVLNRHSYISFRSYRKKAAAINIIGFAAGAVPGGSAWGLAVDVIGRTVQVILAATISGYSRELEREADIYAVDALIASGYDARQIAATFELLQGTHDLESDAIFYNDHPKLRDRIDYVTAIVKSKEVTTPPASGAEEKRVSFRNAVERVCRQNALLAIDAGRYRSAVALAQRLVDEDPASSEYAYLLAESYRALGPRTVRPAGKDLGSAAKKDAHRVRSRLTTAEEEEALLIDPDGQSTWRANQQKAEQLYLRALELDASNYKSHRGLGLLFEKAGKAEDAVRSYRRYLELALEPADRDRIRRRIEALQKIGATSS